jgi:hypothetical protein
LKNYEILLIRPGTSESAALTKPYPNVGRAYTAPQADCLGWAHLSYPALTLHTAANLRERDAGEDNETFALRCVAALHQIFTDLTRADVQRAAVIMNEEAIVTLLAGCGMPRNDPTACCLEPGEAWLISMSAYLWQKGSVFEIIGKLGGD